MTQTLIQPRPPLSPTNPGGSRPIAIAVVGLLLLAGPLPMLVKLGRSLWDREQYQFFPLMVVGAVAVAWDRWQDVPRAGLRRGSNAVAGGLLAAALAVLVASALLWTRSLSLVATLLLLAGVAWHVGGRRLLRAMVPPLVLLAVLVPPPGHQEQGVTLRLQHLAVGVSCRLLDALHVPNAQAGNVIEIPGRRLLIEQACSGINSLMAVLAFTLLYGFYLRRSAGRLVVLLPVAVLFVVGGNIVRITTEAWLKVRTGVDVSEGVAHQLLGLVLFAGCVGLVASFDALLGGGGAVAPPAAAAGRLRLRLGPPAWAAAAVFAVVGAWVESRVWPAWQPSAVPASATFDLPPTLAGWDRVSAGAAVVERPQTEAAKSFVWQFRRGDTFASVAFDYPFVGYHELVICYSVSGWTARSETPVGATRHVEMDKSVGSTGGTHGYLLFAQSDEAGRPVSPSFAWDNATGWGRLKGQLAYARQTAVAGPSYQTQALLQTPAPATADDRRAAEALFAAARADLTAQLQRQTGGGR